MDLKKFQPSPSMVVALIALFVALSGAAYAGVTLSNNTVRSNHIVNGQVKAVDLGANSVIRGKIKNNAVNSSKIADGQVSSADIGDGQVSSADIADGTITTGDVSAAALTDLNDASTVGGLSVAQIVEATGGKYFEARQAAGNVDIETLTPQELVTLNLPAAGKYLISARMPVVCTYDGSDTGVAPTNTITLRPFLISKAQLVVDGVISDTVTETCEAEAGQLIFLVAILQGRHTVTVTRQIEVTGPATVQLRGLAETSVLLTSFPAGARINGNAAGSMLQAITVRT